MAKQRNYSKSFISKRTNNYHINHFNSKFVFDEFERRTDMEYKMYVSFMEIYNEQAYDLLDQRHVEIPIENWNKVLKMIFLN